MSHSSSIRIPGTPLFLVMLEDHGGWVPIHKFTRYVWLALEQSNSLGHLALGLKDILNDGRSSCYVVFSDVPIWGDKESLGSFLILSGTRQYVYGFCFFNYPHLIDREVGQIGIVLSPEARGKGYGRLIIHHLLAYAFDELSVHRVVASILCPVHSPQTSLAKKQALIETKKLCHIFHQCGFSFEGITRGAVANGEIWQDVHRLSILDIEWLSIKTKGLLNPPKSSENRPSQNPWEEMEQRHEAERNEMLRWHEGSGIHEADDDDDETAYYCSDGSSEDFEDSDE
ncbi:GNAT family acetyltransferase [Ceratobasidium sp. AG-Ba]|nr:GNAT family acetyltransferase [Ceratobasidium sp. AG-Ba]QRW10676.1 GNAT family acetyltransferase [Ceratobasidium sp. AG-Ba]